MLKVVCDKGLILKIMQEVEQRSDNGSYIFVAEKVGEESEKRLL